MHGHNTWSISITNGIIKARAMCCSFLLSARIQHVQAQFGVVNGLGDSSNTTNVEPHEFFDHTTSPDTGRAKGSSKLWHWTKAHEIGVLGASGGIWNMCAIPVAAPRTPH